MSIPTYYQKMNNCITRSQWPVQETTAITKEKRLVESEESPANKRWKSSSSQTTIEGSIHSNEFPVSFFGYNPVSERGPIGLRLTKSPSLLELIQTMLSQNNQNIDALPSENIQVGDKKYVKSWVRAPGSTDKLKASNFPALLLKIGKWEYVSQHEGDLVAKCYFAKQRLIWEVLDGGLKNKIEIQWSDIVGLKAHCPDNGPGSLTIVLGKEPLFFRETNPQPKKHTVWQASTDFTNGEANTYRQHYLQCSKGVLNKHYENLIQCDTRLYFLSQQLDTVFDLPFAARDSIQYPNASYSYSINNKGTLDFAHGDFIKECGSGLQGSKTVNTPRVPQSMPISGQANHIGHFVSEKKPDQDLPVFENASLASVIQNAMINNVSEILLNDKQSMITASSGNAIHNQNQNENQNQDQNWNWNDFFDHWDDEIDYLIPDCDLMTDNMICNNEFELSWEDSPDDFLDELPSIASLPHLFSEDDKILKP